MPSTFSTVFSIVNSGAISTRPPNEATTRIITVNAIECRSSFWWRVDMEVYSAVTIAGVGRTFAGPRTVM